MPDDARSQRRRELHRRHPQRCTAGDERDVSPEQQLGATGRGGDGRGSHPWMNRAHRKRDDRSLRRGEHAFESPAGLVPQDPGSDVRFDRHDGHPVEAQAAFDLAPDRLRRPAVEDALEAALVVLGAQMDAIGAHASEHGSEEPGQGVAGAAGRDRGLRGRARVDVHGEEGRVGGEQPAVDPSPQRRPLQRGREVRDLVVHRRLIASRGCDAVDFDARQHAT